MSRARQISKIAGWAGLWCLAFFVTFILPCHMMGRDSKRWSEERAAKLAARKPLTDAQARWVRDHCLKRGTISEYEVQNCYDAAQEMTSIGALIEGNGPDD